VFLRKDGPNGRISWTPSAGKSPVEGAQAAGTYDGGQIIIEGAPVSMDREARITEAGDHRFFAGWRSDPFFFDVMGALNNFQFTGSAADFMGRRKAW
jgi:hypothetical protein